MFSDHLITAGVRALSFQQTPESVLWAVLNDGGLAAVTYSAEQNVIALTPCPTDGVVESICTVPEGTMDVTYIIVRRTFTAGARRYIERVNWTANPGMDSRLELTGASATTWGGFGHIGKAAAVLRWHQRWAAAREFVRSDRAALRPLQPWRRACSMFLCDAAAAGGGHGGTGHGAGCRSERAPHDPALSGNRWLQRQRDGHHVAANGRRPARRTNTDLHGRQGNHGYRLGC